MSGGLYSRVPRNLWRWPPFRRLPLDARLAYLALVTGPGSVAVPGLVEGDALTMASWTGESTEWADKQLATLEAAGLVEMDADCGMVRLPHAPGWEPTASHKTLAGWWNTWRNLPTSPLKIAHVASLKAACDFTGEGMTATWERTFATAAPDASAPPSEGLAKGLGSPCQAATARATAVAEQQQQQEQQQEQDRAPDGAAPSQGTIPGVVSGEGKATRKRSASEPPPVVTQAYALLKAAAGDTFVAVAFPKSNWTEIATWVKSYGLDAFTLVGEHRKAIGADFDASKLHFNFLDWYGAAQKWDRTGRLSLSGPVADRTERRGAMPAQQFHPEVTP